MNDATYFGTMMVKMGDADGLAPRLPLHRQHPASRPA